LSSGKKEKKVTTKGEAGSFLRTLGKEMVGGGAWGKKKIGIFLFKREEKEGEKPYKSEGGSLLRFFQEFDWRGERRRIVSPEKGEGRRRGRRL